MFLIVDSINPQSLSQRFWITLYIRRAPWDDQQLQHMHGTYVPCSVTQRSPIPGSPTSAAAITRANRSPSDSTRATYREWFTRFFLEVDPEEKQHTVNSRSGRLQLEMCWYFVCSGEAVCFLTWVPMENLTVLDPVKAFKVCNGNLDTHCIINTAR